MSATTLTGPTLQLAFDFENAATHAATTPPAAPKPQTDEEFVTELVAKPQLASWLTAGDLGGTRSSDPIDIDVYYSSRYGVKTWHLELRCKQFRSSGYYSKPLGWDQSCSIHGERNLCRTCLSAAAARTADRTVQLQLAVKFTLLSIEVARRVSQQPEQAPALAELSARVLAIHATTQWLKDANKLAGNHARLTTVNARLSRFLTAQLEELKQQLDAGRNQLTAAQSTQLALGLCNWTDGLTGGASSPLDPDVTGRARGVLDDSVSWKHFVQAVADGQDVVTAAATASKQADWPQAIAAAMPSLDHHVARHTNFKPQLDAREFPNHQRWWEAELALQVQGVLEVAAARWAELVEVFADPTLPELAIRAPKYRWSFLQGLPGIRRLDSTEVAAMVARRTLPNWRDMDFFAAPFAAAVSAHARVPDTHIAGLTKPDAVMEMALQLWDTRNWKDLISTLETARLIAQ